MGKIKLTKMLFFLQRNHPLLKCYKVEMNMTAIIKSLFFPQDFFSVSLNGIIFPWDFFSQLYRLLITQIILVLFLLID